MASKISSPSIPILHIHNTYDRFLDDVIQELNTIQEDFVSSPYAKKFPHVTRKLTLLKQEGLKEIRSLCQSSASYANLQEKAADIKTKMFALLQTTDYTAQQNNNLAITQLTESVARMKLQTTKFLTECSDITMPYVKAAGMGIAESVESFAHTILHPIDSIVAPALEFIDDTDTLARYDLAMRNHPQSKDPGIIKAREIREKRDQQKQELQAIGSVITEGTGPERTRLAANVIASCLLPAALSKLSKLSIGCVKKLPGHLKLNQYFVETNLTTSQGGKGILSYSYSLENDTLMVYVTQLKASHAHLGASTQPAGLCAKTLDILTTLAASKGARRLLLQFKPLNKKIPRLMENHFPYHGDQPLFHKNFMFTRGRVARYSKDSRISSFPVFEIPLSQKIPSMQPTPYYAHTLKLVMAAKSTHDQHTANNLTWTRSLPSFEDTLEKIYHLAPIYIASPFPEGITSLHLMLASTCVYRTAPVIAAIALSVLDETRLNRHAMLSHGDETVVYILPKKDSNSATHSIEFPIHAPVLKLSQNRKLVVKRIDSPQELDALLRQHHNISHLWIFLHGSSKYQTFSRNDGGGYDASIARNWHLANFTPNAQIVLNSCSTGDPTTLSFAESLHYNLKNNATVIAAATEIYIDSANITDTEEVFFFARGNDVTVRFPKKEDVNAIETYPI